VYVNGKELLGIETPPSKTDERIMAEARQLVAAEQEKKQAEDARYEREVAANRQAAAAEQAERRARRAQAWQTIRQYLASFDAGAAGIAHRNATTVTERRFVEAVAVIRSGWAGRYFVCISAGGGAARFWRDDAPTLPGFARQQR
jgi:hypothetical protein